jgi:hypothetical protein
MQGWRSARLEQPVAVQLGVERPAGRQQIYIALTPDCEDCRGLARGDLQHFPV